MSASVLSAAAAAAPEASDGIPIHAGDSAGKFISAAFSTCDKATGKTDVQQSSSCEERSMADFEVVRHLGRGAFGQVLEV